MDQDLRWSVPAYTKVGGFLLRLLARVYNANRNLPVFAPYANDWKHVEAALHQQLMRYTRCLIPFHQVSNAATSQDYWEGMLAVPGADILGYLGVLMTSLVPNSMAEERTMSVLNKFNTPDRASQKVSTLFDMALVRQFYKHESNEVEEQPVRRPTVRFADLTKYVQAAAPQQTTPLPGGSTASPSDSRSDAIDSIQDIEPEDNAFDVEVQDVAPALGSRREFEVEAEDGIYLPSKPLTSLLSDTPSPPVVTLTVPSVIPSSTNLLPYQPVDVSKLVY
ncbi:hypothetical protein BDV93DRAFT_222922 [Ceratobasidium sp. AG-I]|nr:hypothetical protein BDV93DRAFT_222922 [Ceratobasidium sp. AG-I]